jgi:hypothetical protein
LVVLGVFYWETTYVLEKVALAADAKAVGYAPAVPVKIGVGYGVTVETKNLILISWNLSC